MIEVGQSIILTGDVSEMLTHIPDKSIQCCVTSPPYFGLRDYGVDGQIGLEQTPQAYVEKLVSVFREVRRVLRDDGTVWLNLGDAYNAGRNGGHAGGTNGVSRPEIAPGRSGANVPGLKAKDLIGIPWRVAFALQADGWYLRQDIIWAKPNPMPESVRDRCTKAHEYIFMFSKSAKYYYDNDAIAEPVSEAMLKQLRQGYNGKATKDYESARAQDASAVKARILAKRRISGTYSEDSGRNDGNRHPSGGYVTGTETRNKRSVWTVTTKPFKGAHFATFPPDLIEPCILAGSRPGDVVLDPFGGSGTVGLVANRHGRQSVLIELNPKYVEIAQARLQKDLYSNVGTMSDNLHSKVA